MKSSLAAVEARDPQTSVQRLYEIAASSPELHADLLLNPACTEALRSWILQAGPQSQASQQPGPPPAPAPPPATSRGRAADPAARPQTPAATAGFPAAPGQTTAQRSVRAAGAASPSTLELPVVIAPLPDVEGATSELPPVAPQPRTAPAPPATLPPPVLPASAQAGRGLGAPLGRAPAEAWQRVGPATPHGGWVQPAAPRGRRVRPAAPQGLTPRRAAWLVGAVVLVLVLVLGVRALVGGRSSADGGSGAADTASTASPTSGADQAVTAGPSPQVTALSPSPTPSRRYSGTKRRPAPADAFPAQLIDTQTQNIYCQISDERAACSIRERYYSAAGAQDCSGELFSITVVDGAPQLACGESFLGAAGQVPQRLAPQQYAASGNFACLVETSGVSCWNQWTGHGFKLAREGYQTF